MWKWSECKNKRHDTRWEGIFAFPCSYFKQHVKDFKHVLLSFTSLFLCSAWKKKKKKDGLHFNHYFYPLHRKQDKKGSHFPVRFEETVETVAWCELILWPQSNKILYNTKKKHGITRKIPKTEKHRSMWFSP